MRVLIFFHILSERDVWWDVSLIEGRSEFLLLQMFEFEFSSVFRFVGRAFHYNFQSFFTHSYVCAARGVISSL